MAEFNLKKKVNEFLSNRKYSNNLTEIFSCLDTVESVKPNTLLSIQKLFVELLKKHAMSIQGLETREGKTSKEAEEKYRLWLRDCYKSLSPKLMNLLQVAETDVQIQTMSTVMHLVQTEAMYPVMLSKPFPEENLQLIIQNMLSSPFFPIFIQRFKDIIHFKDVIFYSFKSLSNLSGDLSSNEEILMNTLNFLKEFSVPNSREKLFPTTAKAEDFLSQKLYFSLDVQEFCKYATKIWEILSDFKQHNSGTTKLLLIVLIDKLMYYHSNPILVTDFLMNALAFKGPIAVLALQGMVNLVRQYNLEYPNVFDKLYALLEPNIFYTKYKGRLFYLTDLLMMSTHLPEALVASFIKRLARLSLTAPPQDVAIMIYLIGNLVLRHKGLTVLFQNTDETELETDPFDNNEKDPYKSNALKSSLWELKILQNHPLYTVNVPARFISNPLPNVEWDLGTYLEVTYDEIFHKEFKKKQKEISTNFEKPVSMFQPSNSKIFDHFSLL